MCRTPIEAEKLAQYSKEIDMIIFEKIDQAVTAAAEFMPMPSDFKDDNSS